MKSKYNIIIFLLLLVIPLISINSNSFWLDEILTAYIYSKASFVDMIRELLSTSGSEIQMPGWMIFMWGWSQLFGITEYALRLSNLIFIIPLILTFYSIIKSNIFDKHENKILAIASILSILNPFVIYNLNEARVNIPMYSLSFMTVLQFIAYLKTYDKKYIKRSFTLFIIGYSFNMLFSLLFFSLLILVSEKKNLNHIIKNNIKSIVVLFLFCLPITCYYLFTLVKGKGGQIETPGIMNVGYSLYEFMGLSGVGADKNTIRNNTDKILLVKQYLPMLLPFICSYILLVSANLKTPKSILKNVYFKAFIFGFLIFIIVAFTARFRFWGRHLFYLYPLFILFISTLILNYLDLVRSKKIYSIVLLSWCVCWSISSFRMLYNDEYKKENIKEMASIALNFKKQDDLLFWTEHWNTAWYYDIYEKPGVLCRFPENTETGILVWAKRGEWLNGEKFKNSVLNRNYETLYDSRDFTIYRLN